MMHMGDDFSRLQSFDKPRVPPPSNKDSNDADEDCIPDSNPVHDRRL